MKTYAALVRDHSGSMRSIKSGAMADFNLTIDGMKSAVRENLEQQIRASVIECGVGYRAEVRVRESMRPISQFAQMSSYTADGGATPLWDSVGQAINEIETLVPYSDMIDPTTAYIVMVITDGHENSSRTWDARKIAEKIRQLQATDKWTFVFRVPRGNAAGLVKMGIPSGNIMEWEQNERDLERSTVAHVAATQSYFKSRSAGATSVAAFYADASALTSTEVKAQLVDISNNVLQLTVHATDNGMMIRDFCERHIGRGKYKTGEALYQLTKREEVQDYKRFAVRDNYTGHIYSGAAARQLLGLPSYGTIKVIPVKGGQYDVFVQSNSVNRKLVAGTSVLYFK